MSDLVENPEDWFSHVMGHFIDLRIYIIALNKIAAQLDKELTDFYAICSQVMHNSC